MGDPVNWSASNLVQTGWLNNCVAHQALHGTGLTFHDDASLTGVLTPLVEKEVWFTAFNTVNNEIVRLNLHLYVNTHRPPLRGGFESVDAEVSRGANAAVAHYNKWEQRRQSHAATIHGMNAEFARMKAVLDHNPLTGKGFGWGVLGALHMNTHKLLENVLLEAELYLGEALTFGAGAGLDFSTTKAVVFAEENLKGCFAKRQLEAAKYLWREGMERTVVGMDGMFRNGATRLSNADEKVWVDIAQLFERAAELKEGWGWGVNNGEIYLALASVNILRGGLRVDAGCTLVKQANARNEHFQWTRFMTEFCSGQRNVGLDFIQGTRKWMQKTLEVSRPTLRASDMPLLPWGTRSGSGGDDL